MKNLTLICEAKVKLAPNADEAQNSNGKIEAKVTTWGAREGADGRKFNYQPEGFADWAKEFASAGKPLPMFLNHNDLGMPMGEWTEFAFDEDGMTASGRLYLNTVGGSDLYQILKESPDMFGGVSVSAYAENAQMVDEAGEPLPDQSCEDGYFQITKGGLREVSVVMYPNNPNAGISKLEYFNGDGVLNPRMVEKTLRDAGFSKRDALTASSIFKRVLESRDAPEPIKETPNLSDSDAVENEAKTLLRAFETRELIVALQSRLN
jgi:HK97 family phage prohead protease